MQREDVVSNASILDGILGSLSWQELCVASQVCSTWKQVADDHQKWEELCRAQTARSDTVPRRIGLGTDSTYTTILGNDHKPSVLRQDTSASAKDRFKAFWTDHVCLGCLEAVLGKDIVRSHCQEAWDMYSAKEHEQGFPYPQAVKRLLCIKHIDSLALSLYPTNNHLDTRGRAFPSPPHLVGAGKYAMKIIDENQGCCWWYVVFSPGHEDPPVYICESQLPEGGSDSDEEAREELQDLHDMLLQNASFAQFWADYLKEGLKWHESTNGVYLEGELCATLRELHPWMPIPAAADGSVDCDSASGKFGDDDDV